MFTIRSMDVGLTAPFSYLEPTEGETIVAGEALKVAAGKLTKAGGTDQPEYIAVGPANSFGTAPVIRVQSFMELETQLSAAGAALSIGDKVTISEDGLRVTATTEGGVARIIRMDGTAAGDTVCVRF